MSAPVNIPAELRKIREEEMAAMKEFQSKLAAATPEEKVALQAEFKAVRNASRDKMIAVMQQGRPPVYPSRTA